MPISPASKPPLGIEVTITLANGSKLPAQWDGVQWWASLSNDPNAAPVVNGFVVSWEYPTE